MARRVAFGVPRVRPRDLLLPTRDTLGPHQFGQPRTSEPLWRLPRGMKKEAIAAFRLQDQIAQELLGSTDLSLRSWCKNRNLNYRSISDAVRGERPMQLVHVANILEASDLQIVLRPLGKPKIVDGRRLGEEHAAKVGPASVDGFDRARDRILEAASELVRRRRSESPGRRLRLRQDSEPRHATRAVSGVIDEASSTLSVFLPADRESQLVELGTDMAPSGRLIVQISGRRDDGAPASVDVLDIAPLTRGGNDFQFVTDTEDV